MENTIIIGGGVAGLSAAIYLARAGLKPLILAGSPPGGQLSLTSDVENYPGVESILGPELIERMRAQAKKFGARIIDENVTEVKFNKSEILNPKSEANPNNQNVIPAQAGIQNKIDSRLRGNDKKKEIVSNFDIRASRLYLTKSVIIATGAKALWLGLESETKLRGHGVSACATCDGFFFRDKIVAVVGGGDTAMEEALTLTKFAKIVYIIHRRGEFRASKIMQERVLKHSKIEIIYNAVVAEIMGERKVEGIQLKSVKTGLNKLKLDGIFIAIGHIPDTNIFKNQIELDKKGYIVTTNRIAIENLNIENSLKIENLKLKIQKFDSQYMSQTSVPGVFAAGDCVDHIYQQAATASGMGVAAALDVVKYLESI